MNVVEQIKETIYQQWRTLLLKHAVAPNDVKFEIRVSHVTRMCIVRDLEITDLQVLEDGFMETILGFPLVANKDTEDGVYYLHPRVCNQQLERLKFTVKADTDVIS